MLLLWAAILGLMARLLAHHLLVPRVVVSVQTLQVASVVPPRLVLAPSKSLAATAVTFPQAAAVVVVPAAPRAMER